jgi:4-hydroxythreonine-4-phosphate dehydrogenase
MMPKLKLAFTCGDPAGIGPEVIAAWLAANPGAAGEVAVIGPARWLAGLPAGEKLAVGLEGFAAKPGRPDGEGALVAWAALERAAAGCRAGEFAGVVTGPISKEALARIGWSYPGQTEFFGARWGGEPTMGFCGGRMRVVLATWHIPLRAVPESLSAAVLRRTVAAADHLARAAGGVARPRIGVCGLNPHAGEGGILGTEERERIDPILDALRGEFPALSRTQAADTLFARHLRGEFDVVVALYHDQGLGPLKTVDFDTSVNVSLGLPHVRTSPDHGTAFGIAGKGLASGTSFANAVALARRLAGLTV